MIENKELSNNCFREFDDIAPKRKNPTIQSLYEYEKHYMELLRKYSQEILMLDKMLSDFRKEQELFYKETLPEIIAKFNQDMAIEEEMKNIWLKRLTMNMDRSFALSETLINDFAIKKIDEFKATVKEKLEKL